jgi:D-alanyl-D-alanine carboxypeptidase/D-alanyl-D-alanine-endopeptidase (penicillin-binding protein 4)
MQLALTQALLCQQSSGPLSRRVERLISATPLIQRGRIGYKVVDVETGELLAQRDSAKFFTPASNTKLYTTAFAMVRLGPNYRFETELRTGGAWVPGQTRIRELELIGGGDPNLSGRVLPYAADSKPGDPLAALEDLADKLVNAGIREIDGDVTGVATRYPGDRYPDGWTIDDAVYSYGAPVTSLALNDNAASIELRPTETRELAEVQVRPTISHFIILNEVITDDSKTAQIQILRPPGSNELVLWGTIGKGVDAWRVDVAVNDPALFAAEGLIQVLRERGVMVRGVARAQYRNLNDVETSLHRNRWPLVTETILAVNESAPLWEAVQVINKVSQNLHAEMLLREAAQAMRGTGTLAAGLEEREKFLEDIGIPRAGTGFAFGDGSGLARQGLTTPDSTVALLRYMWHFSDRDLWLQSLPIGGVDGTLADRFHNIRGAERVHAKTGEIRHVNALSGYIDTRRNRWLTFSIMVNATIADDADVHDFLDHFCAIFIGY